jgi:hypothetical protein
MYYANLKYLEKNKDVLLQILPTYKDSFEDRYIKGLLFIFFPILLFICVFLNGIKVLKKDRSIFSGEVL